MQAESAPDRFTPHVTVATVIEHEGKYLLVEEIQSGQKVLNQPAGHLEPDETLVEAALREVLEETGWEVKLTAVLCVGLYTAPSNAITYYRTTFIAEPIRQTDRPLDSDIERVLWLTPEEIAEHSSQPRSPMVLQAIVRHRAGIQFPLDLIC